MDIVARTLVETTWILLHVHWQRLHGYCSTYTGRDYMDIVAHTLVETTWILLHIHW